MISHEDFTRFLADQIPIFDEAILKDIRPKDRWLLQREIVHPIRIDARLLPNRYRRIWIMYAVCCLPSRMIAHQIHWKPKSVRRAIVWCNERIHDRLYHWIKNLPKNQRRKERRKRKPFFNGADHSKDYFNVVFPKVA